MKAPVQLASACALALLLFVGTARVEAQAPPHVPGSNQHVGADLDTFFVNTLASQKYVALGASIVKKDRIVWEGYYGYADREKGVPLAKENIYKLLSLSKTVTACAVMMLYERGKLNLDEDVNRYLPFHLAHPAFPKVPITFRMLLNHTAGFADVTPTGLRVPKNVDRPPTAPGDSPITLEEYARELLAPGGKLRGSTGQRSRLVQATLRVGIWTVCGRSPDAPRQDAIRSACASRCGHVPDGTPDSDDRHDSQRERIPSRVSSSRAWGTRVFTSAGGV